MDEKIIPVNETTNEDLLAEENKDLLTKEVDTEVHFKPDLQEEVEEVVKEEVESIYIPSEDTSLPDFDKDKIEEAIKNSSYLELPLWKRKLTALKNNMEQVRSFLNSYANLQELAKMGLNDQLNLINDMKKEGIDIEMQLSSFNEKYEVNYEYIQSALKKIEDRLINERTDVEKSFTSVKRNMMFQMIEKNMKEVPENHPNRKKLDAYFNMMRDTYQTANDVSWMYHLFETGTNARALYTRYKKAIKEKSIEEIFKEVFNFDYVPENVPFETEDEKNFFYYFIAYVGRVSQQSGMNIKARKNRERAICVLQNLGDCDSNLFDLRLPGDVSEEIRSNEECAKLYYDEILKFSHFLYAKAKGKK